MALSVGSVVWSKQKKSDERWCDSEMQKRKMVEDGMVQKKRKMVKERPSNAEGKVKQSNFTWLNWCIPVSHSFLWREDQSFIEYKKKYFYK